MAERTGHRPFLTAMRVRMILTLAVAVLVLAATAPRADATWTAENGYD